MPFGMMRRLGPTNSVLRGSDDHRRESGNFGGKHNTWMNCELDWSMQRRAQDGQTLDCKRLDESVIRREGERWDCTPWAKFDIYD